MNKTLSLKELNGRPKLASFTGLGLTSRKDVRVELYAAEPGSGITFYLPWDGDLVAVPATADNVVFTLRNVVLGKGRTRLCIVEHFLCATSIYGVDDLDVFVDGMEMPLGDGSSHFWMDFLEEAGIERKIPQADIALSEPITIERGDRALLAIPSDRFSVTYLMDWKHPQIGKCWQTWDVSKDLGFIYDARTFGMLADSEMFGLDNDVVSLTDDGFTKPLRSPDEPVRHKLLDLIGDLSLAGVNPLRWKARFISIKAGHEMDVEMAKRLMESLPS